MFFFVLFLIGLIIPFIMIKVNPSWIVWAPSIILFLAAIAMYGKAEFFPGEGMADLAERLYFIIFGMTAIGSIVGGIIVHLLRNK
ncbi:hypothetical protein [Neobacillus niacini]|uniref:hypothetical protein n=1 Tax=Neobacillus niacini TaxID=86668 RepID=UPI0005EF9AAE|nr:hypothetical protein [Neobacillus niacini]